ncbi:major capsid protein [Thorsellia anophelis]|uniref:Major capsid protein n=1 Tax=Thorsellia anophelis DSM 18579 TaxID=1123402 RepID=A0A1I0D7U0_9GAMM|nr:major capsid protein [Thorsellia anophelis]SET28327.1 hypothetical protein SAMN02583745_01889 [Thorsellia anophelis DSM 18579]
MPFDLAKFNQQTYTAITELASQNINAFNEASAGTIIIENKPITGDEAVRASFKLVNGLVRRRDVNSDADINSTRLQQLVDIAVKVAAGTPTLLWDNAQYNWVRQNPQLAAYTIGEQLARARTLDMVNSGVRAAVAAISGNADVTHDGGANNASFAGLTDAGFKFGDRSSAIKAWIMHSGAASQLYQNALTNNERLFSYEGVNIQRDPFGRLIVVTDSEALVQGTGDTRKFRSLGLTDAAVRVASNDDFDAVLERTTGKENITSKYQSEWSYNLSVQGYKWLKENGGVSPTDTSIGTSANWERSASSHKDTAGVLYISKG